MNTHSSTHLINLSSLKKLSEIPLKLQNSDLQGGGVKEHQWTTTANTAVSDLLLILMLRRKRIRHWYSSESQI